MPGGQPGRLPVATGRAGSALRAGQPRARGLARGEPVDRRRPGRRAALAARLPTVAEPVGGTVIDAEARSTIGAILARLEQHGLIEG